MSKHSTQIGVCALFLLCASLGVPKPVDAFSSLQGMGEAKSGIIYVEQSAATRCCLACNSTFSRCVASLQDRGQPTPACQLKYNDCVTACPDWKTCKNQPAAPGKN
jgi:hypothetical protein